MARFRDKRVLISGGASGIGLAAARLFREEAARVAIADIDAERLKSASIDLGGPDGVIAIEGDVASMPDGQRIVATAAQALGGVDVLVCNAGIPSRSPILELSEEEFDRVIAVNLKGMFTLIKAAAPLMIEQGGGTIVTVGSELSFVADPETPAYNASKGAVVMFTKAIALDLIRHGIRVNAMCPGTTWTPLIEQELATSPDPAALRADLDAWGPIGRVARPDEQARGILFLASDDSSYAVGTSLVIDGGFTAR